MVLLKGTVMQLAVGTILACIFLLLQVMAAPYRDRSSGLLASSCSFSIVVIMVCAIFFKFSELTDLDDINELMSDEQRHVSPPNRAACKASGIYGFCLMFLGHSHKMHRCM